MADVFPIARAANGAGLPTGEQGSVAGNPLRLGCVSSEAELAELIGTLQTEHAQCRLFFRGQVKLHPTVIASRNRLAEAPNGLVESAWIAFASKALGLERPRSTSGQVKAILQHYGVPTHFLDVTSNPQVAAWFAKNRFASKSEFYVGTIFRTFERVAYGPENTACGYIIVFAIPDPSALTAAGRLFDLAALPDGFVRPKRQNAWLLLDRPPTKPDPNDFIVGLIEVAPTFASSLTQRQLFPPPGEDPCYARLLSIPFVEIPMEWFSQPSEAHLFKNFRLASRALATPEYAETHGKPLLNHKWQDIWIYEPKPMRQWKEWRFDLATVHPPLTGDICDAAKVTVSPSAHRILTVSNQLELEWPALGHNGLFITEAQLEHDKFSDHGPPYYGVWLQKHEELLVETPMESDFETLSVLPGHAYVFADGNLQRQFTSNGCRCPYPESHDLRVATALRLSAAIRAGLVLLVPHARVPGSYVAFTEADMEFMSPGINRSQEMMRQIFVRLAEQRKVVKSTHP